MNRSGALRIRNLLDDWLPPAVRDSRVLMYPLLRLALGRHWREFADFKEHGLALSAEEFAAVYARVAEVSSLQGETDLNDRCAEAILKETIGPSVLEAGCGRGWLAERLTEVVPEVTGCDICRDPGLADRPGLRFLTGSVEALPFPDNSFDSVICTHTLEHVQRLPAALAELRRVARQRLIIVVPRERPYRYTFSLHLHAFPYPWSWQAVAGVVPGARLEDLGDWFYVEDV